MEKKTSGQKTGMTDRKPKSLCSSRKDRDSDTCGSRETDFTSVVVGDVPCEILSRVYG